MKHGIKMRKLSRTSSHRQALLRNLVSALLHHEQIQTTLPKAKEAARLAEKIITLGKKGTEPAWRSAQAMLFPAHHYATPVASTSSSILDATLSSSDPESFTPPTTLLPKLFETLSARYADRPGGYTRITKFGRRPGDNAPKALVSLVDGRRDIVEEMCARAVGREVGLVKTGAQVQKTVERVVLGGGSVGDVGLLRGITRKSLGQVLKYRDGESKEAFVRKAVEHAYKLAVAPNALKELASQEPARAAFRPSSINKTTSIPHAGRAGDKPVLNMQVTGLGLARGLLGRGGRRKEKKEGKGLLPL